MLAGGLEFLNLQEYETNMSQPSTAGSFVHVGESKYWERFGLE